MRIPFSGVGTALITPFKKDGSVDEAAVKRLARRQIDAGVHFLSPCGTTGEAPTLSHKEKVRVVELVVEETERRRAGAGGGRRLRHARDHRARARHGQGRRGRPAFGHALLQQADARRPVSALQGDRAEHASCRSCSTTCRRGRRSTWTSPPRRGFREIQNIVGVKAPGDLVHMSELVSATREGFLVLSGDDPVAVAAMAVGGAGVVSVASNEAPAEMTQIIEMCEKGDYAGARKLHHWLLPLIQVNFVESNPIPCKAAMAAMGLIDEVYRLPLVSPSPAAREKVMAVLQQLRLLGAAARAS